MIFRASFGLVCYKKENLKKLNGNLYRKHQEGKEEAETDCSRLQN